MFSIEEAAAPVMSLWATLTVSVVALIMNLLTTLLNVLSPIDARSLPKPKVRRPPQLHTAKLSRYVLVTGCDRGFGYAVARRLDELGFFVIAGCLLSENCKKLQNSSSERLTSLQLDVTKDDHIKYIEEWVQNNVPDRGFWGIVNNSGVCRIGPPEVMAWEDVSTIIDVNFRGVVNVTRTFVPYLRRSQGRIVNMGSLNGDVPMPFFSIYNATKAAVKMFSETISYELQDWGVKVSVVAPSAFKTGIIMYNREDTGNKWWACARKQVQDDYGREFFSMPMRVSGRMKVREDVSPVVNAVVDALTSDSPKPLYRTGRGSIMLPAVMKFLPNSFRAYLCGSLLNFISSKPRALADCQQD